jgi:deoxyadenosine/deoxycytidine kinase
MSAKLISVIGPPASGKTTLAERLSAELPATLIRENYAGNPFLTESYLGRREARLPGQLYFLVSRVGQFSRLTWPSSGLLVSDYGFCQDRIYARARLEDGDYRVYDRLARRVGGLVHPPNLLILLDAADETLLDRIARRGREFERVMDKVFLTAIRRAYNEAVRRAKCPVLRIDCDETDVREVSARASLVEEIRGRLGQRMRA